MIRTLHIINGLGAGGAERSLAELLPDLPDYGITPNVALFDRTAQGVEMDVRRAGIPVHRIAATTWRRRIGEVRRLIRCTRPDLVHTTLFESDIIGRIAALGTGVPVLTSLVNTSYEPIRLADPAVRRHRLEAARLLDATTAHLGRTHFHAITEAVRGSAIDRLHLDAQRITVIPRSRQRSRLGDPSVERRRAVRERLGIAQDAVIVLHVGREEYQKGHSTLINALAPVLLARPDVTLLMAGRQGNASAEIDRLVARLPPDQYRRLGHVDEIPDLLAACDVFVFPSRYEGLGGAALEAMAMGVPIVASDLPALHEFLDGVARFVEPTDAVDLRTGIEAVLDNPAVAERRARDGVQRFDAGFDHDVVTRAMAELFVSCARSDTAT